MMNKKILIGSVILLLIAIIFGSMYVFNHMTLSHREIYDDNSAIIKVADSYTYVNKSGTSKKNETSLTFELTGMETLWKINAEKEGSIDIDYTSSINDGQLKLVLIKPDDSIDIIFEQSDTGIKSFKVQKGLNRIKIVGRQAKGTVKFKIHSDKEIELKASE